MKLRVNISQMKLLPEHALANLIDWWVPRNNDNILPRSIFEEIKTNKIEDLDYNMHKLKRPVWEVKQVIGMKDEDIKLMYIPLLSISRMIEFLNGKEMGDSKYIFTGITYNHKFGRWYVEFGDGKFKFTDAMLTDALWEAVSTYLISYYDTNIS